MRKEIEALIEASKIAWVLIKEQEYLMDDEGAEEINYNLREAIRAMISKLAEEGE